MSKIKRTIALLFVSACLILSGCSGSGNLDSTEPTTILDLHEENISVNLYQKVPAMNVRVSDNEGRFDLSVDAWPSDKISNFGIYVLEVQAAFENEFSEEERGSFSFYLAIDSEPATMISFSSDDYAESAAPLSGTVYDSRSGELVFHKITDVESLCELFPATSAHISKSEMDPDDLSIYEEVMEILNDQIDRPEDEILEEIAPNYGMTAEELKLFLREMMEQIYQ